MNHDLQILRAHATDIFRSGVAAADPYLAVKKCLFSVSDQLKINTNFSASESSKRSSSWSKVHVIAFGKAACSMTKAALDSIPAHLLADKALVVTNYENVTLINHTEVIGAGHPLPDQSGFQAAQQCASILSNAKHGELILVLISGGGSALIPYPVDGITLKEKIATTNLLLACGATINQINCVRKHLSQLKGGGMTKLAVPADLHALILSDVLGDDLSAIASGPTVPDPTTFSDAIEILSSRGVWEQAPANVRTYLQQGRLGLVAETPKQADDVFKQSGYTLIGSNTISVDATLQAAQDLGYQAKLYSDHLCGEARDEAEKWVSHAKELILLGITQPIALVAGGETTVTIKGDGKGGRNQEMALAFAIAANKQALTGNWTFLSAGTDGRDGPTDAAGAIVDPKTLTRIINAGVDPVAMLENNDSYTALQSSGDLLITGATGTNVADLQILLIHPTN
jgi:hydroxypyruvate reductase